MSIAVVLSDLIIKCSNDKACLNSFVQRVGIAHYGLDVDDSSIVIIMYDNTHVLLHASDSATYEYLSSADKSKFMSWKVFESHDPAIAFDVQLGSYAEAVLQRKQATDGPPNTDWTEEQAEGFPQRMGQMMYEEDLAVGVDRGTNSGFTGAASVGVAASQLGSTSQVVGSTSLLQGEAIVPSAIGAPVSYDMVNVKLDLGNTGVLAGSPAGVEFAISSGFPHKSRNIIVYMGALTKLNGNLWHFSAEYLLRFLTAYAAQYLTPYGKHVPSFFLTLKGYPTCNRSRPTKFLRSKTGWTKQMIMFVIEVPKLGGYRIDDYIQQAFNTMASNFKNTSDPACGLDYANYLAEHKESAYNHAIGETSSKKKITHDELAKEMQTKLVNAWSKKIVEYNVPLDKYLTYGHIKEFLVDRCGYDGWSDVANELKKSIIGKFPRIALPDWHEIEMDEY